MRQYFRHTREIGFFTNIIAAAVEDRGKGIKGWIGPRWREENGFQNRGGQVRFKTGTPENDPAAMLGIFHEAAHKGLTLHHSALKAIRANAAAISAVRDDAEANRMFSCHPVR